MSLATYDLEEEKESMGQSFHPTLRPCLGEKNITEIIIDTRPRNICQEYLLPCLVGSRKAVNDEPSENIVLCSSDNGWFSILLEAACFGSVILVNWVKIFIKLFKRLNTY